METAVGLERRRAPRTRMPAAGVAISVRIRSGPVASMLEFSAGGVLVESQSRLLPGTTIDLIVEWSDERIVMKGRVMRSSVVRLVSSALSYRTAIAFDHQGAPSPTTGNSGYSVPLRDVWASRWLGAKATPFGCADGAGHAD